MWSPAVLGSVLVKDRPTKFGGNDDDDSEGMMMIQKEWWWFGRNDKKWVIEAPLLGA